MASIFLANRNDYLFAKATLGDQVLKTEFITNSADVANVLEAERMSSYVFVDQVKQGAASLSHCHFEADRIARTFDANLSELRTRIFNFEESSPGWDYLNIYFIALSVLRWKRFAPQLAEAMPARDALAYFTHDNTQDFYFDSALQRDFLGQALRSKYPNAKAFPAPTRAPYVPNAMNYTLEFDPSGSPDIEALVHLPTVYYDYEYHRQRLAGFHGSKLVELASPYFDIPIARDRVTLALSNEAPQPASLAEARYAKEVRRLATELYALLCPGNTIVAAQAERQVARSLSQMRLFDQLCSAPKFANIRYLYICDYDAGLSGPLTTWANLRDIPTEIHPHSSVSVTPFPVMKQGRKHGYVREPDTFAELGNGRSDWAHPLVTTGVTPGCPPLVLLLLNAMTDPAGVPTCQFQTVANFIVSAVKLCAAKGVPCKVRSKASWDVSGLLDIHLRREGIPDATVDAIFATGALGDWAAKTTVCIGIDQPTTALTQFVTRGVDCMNAIDREYTETEMHTLPSRNVHLTDYNGALERLSTLL
jgi:hypothetical protein